MDAFMGSMTAKQALEWEIFAKDNPSFEDVILIQIAYIAQLFASALFKRKDGAGFSIEDFMPWKKKAAAILNKAAKKDIAPDLLSSFKNILLKAGDEKAKAWAKKDEIEVKKVQGTDGKWYNYALEEFATRTKPPKRLSQVQTAVLVKKPRRLKTNGDTGK